VNKVDNLPAYTLRDQEAPRALQGLLVVDFTQFISGPYCTLILADFGADVLKVENPAHGDDFRLMKMGALVGDDGGPFLWANRNKRSVALDLSQQAGREVAWELVKRADVVVENFSAGVMKRFGLDYDSVAALNPGLIYCSISAAGRVGPMSERVAFDPITQAESGFIGLNSGFGAPDRALNTPIVDLTTGMMAATAILAALAARTRLGKGQLVEIAMFDQGINLLAYHALNHLISGAAPVAGPSRSPQPIGVFQTSDSEIYLCCANDRTFRRLVVDALGRDDLAADPRFATMAARLAHPEPFLTILANTLAQDTRENWLTKLRANGVPAGPLATVSEALASAEVGKRGLLSRIPHPVAGSAPHVTPPFRMGLTPVVDPVVAPSLGAHTEEALRDVLDLAPDAFRQLALAGAFGACSEDLSPAKDTKRPSPGTTR
jgi:crotonobetainyl-CoA:carnitine CoA-transferase CaiB-like acyl-CoA transferase